MSEPDFRGISDYLFEKLNDEIGADRIIELETGRFAYIDTEGCAIYLITVQPAQLVPAQASRGGDQ